MIRVWYDYNEKQACECGGDGYKVYECKEPSEAYEFITKKGKSIFIKAITRGEIELSVKATAKREDRDV